MFQCDDAKGGEDKIMKKFFTILPLQEPIPMVYRESGNEQLHLDKAIPFPIFNAMYGYVEAGEEIRVIAVATDVPAAKKNIEVFNHYLKEMCREKNVTCTVGLEVITIPHDESVATHVTTFQRLLDYVEDQDELFACMTYGTKPTSSALMTAMQYAYNLKNNATIECIVYGQVDRSAGKDSSSWVGTVYDMTALIRLDEIIHTLARLNVKDPKSMIDSILSV